MSNSDGTKTTYTGADALTDALVKAGVSYIFVNSGTDYPPIIESWAKYEAKGLPKPKIIICPHEMVALSAAHGYAQATGKAQAVFIHVDVGTQNLGGSVHNAYRCRVPAFILAGKSPFTLEGEMKGTRNGVIQFIQDVYDQGGILREYTKWNYEIHTGKNIQQLVLRAMQIAQSDPKGPVYLMAPREVLEEEGRNIDTEAVNWAPVSMGALPEESVSLLADALAGAKNPLIVTSYLGRNPEAVEQLVNLSERLAIPVVESGRSCFNFPADHPMHLGYAPGPFMKNADLILVIDSDTPWIPAVSQPGKDCRVFYLDLDPIKEDIPLWYIPSEKFLKADSCAALKQLNKYLDNIDLNSGVIAERQAAAEKIHQKQRSDWKNEEGIQETMTPEHVISCLREAVDDNTILVDETTSYHPIVAKHLPLTKPGTLYRSGGSALGWNGGAAIGVKLANPDKNVVSLTGDGTYIFSVPTATHWVANKYKTPFMTVIFNNQGWGAPKLATNREHPDGYAMMNDKYWISFDPPAQLDKVAEAAGGTLAVTVRKPEEVKQAFQDGMNAVKNGKCAVINVVMPPVSYQET